jgi:hypothetical protein
LADNNSTPNSEKAQYLCFAVEGVLHLQQDIFGEVKNTTPSRKRSLRLHLFPLFIQEGDRGSS